MSILVTVLIVTSVWVFLAAVLGAGGGKERRALPETDHLFTGEFWLWERGDGGVGLRAGVRAATRSGAARPDGPALPSPSA